MTEERLCVLCPTRGRRPDHYEQPQACPGCRVWLAGVLRDIADTYPDLADQLQPRRGGGQRVAGSREAPVPLVLDVVDLTGDARPASIAVRYRNGWSVLGGDPDQIGHLSVATELEFWVTDWALMRGKSEGLPEPTVASLARWLSDRLDWAMDQHPAIDEFAAALTRVHGAVRAYVPRVVQEHERPPTQRAEPRTAPCPACDMVSLWWWPSEERVRCDTDGCNRAMTEDEYTAWCRLVIEHEKRGAGA